MTDDSHSKDTAPPTSKFGRGTQYRSAGYDHIKGHGSKPDVYNKRDGRLKSALTDLKVRPATTAPAGKPEKVDPASPEHAARYHLGYGPNFTIAFAPYPNQAHHLIPVSAFSDPPFTDAVMRVLRRVKDYDINEGANIVFLPRTDGWTRFHGLPTHNGDHPKYTEGVKKDLEMLAKEIKKLIKEKQHADCDPPSDVPDQLRRHQDAYWRYLTTSAEGTSVNTATDMLQQRGGR